MCTKVDVIGLFAPIRACIMFLAEHDKKGKVRSTVVPLRDDVIDAINKTWKEDVLINTMGIDVSAEWLAAFAFAPKSGKRYTFLPMIIEAERVVYERGTMCFDDYSTFYIKQKVINEEALVGIPRGHCYIELPWTMYRDFTMVTEADMEIVRPLLPVASKVVPDMNAFKRELAKATRKLEKQFGIKPQPKPSSRIRER